MMIHFHAAPITFRAMMRSWRFKSVARRAELQFLLVLRINGLPSTWHVSRTQEKAKMVPKCSIRLRSVLSPISASGAGHVGASTTTTLI
uniref:Uncharacterized protein n=2 Tax=Caenorhabditis japonica TaxID=281687 RepID=A0A8R1I5E0_CAEJA